jgi:alkylhydroperoxidase family enzyme
LAVFADHLTRHPHQEPEARLDRLREAGFSDEAILAATEVTGYFNFVNRMASGLCVELEATFEP